jgi:hypothetical protein
MGTRCNIHFNDGETVCANIYRHYDGYPGKVVDGKEVEGGVLPDLLTFFTELLENVRDHRFTDPTYLAAKFLVWQAKQNARVYNVETGEYADAPHYLEFLSVGITLHDAGDGEFIYELDCEDRDAKGCPSIRWKSTHGSARFRTVFLHGKPSKAQG